MIKITVKSTGEMKELGRKIASNFHGGETVELIGDVGAGKTTLTKGLAIRLGISDTIQSPSFTLNRAYDGGKFRLSHYDFYRLNEPGLLKAELKEDISDQDTITVIEWSESVNDVLPNDKIKIEIIPISENEREVIIFNLKANNL